MTAVKIDIPTSCIGMAAMLEIISVTTISEACISFIWRLPITRTANITTAYSSTVRISDTNIFAVTPSVRLLLLSPDME